MLYLNAVFSLFTVIGIPLGGSAYILAPVLLSDPGRNLNTTNTVQTLAVLVGLAAYGFAGLAISNGQKRGWKVGVAVAAGAVALPAIATVRGFNLGSGYLITFIFDAALLVALLHPESRNYQRIWFSGPVKQVRRR